MRGKRRTVAPFIGQQGAVAAFFGGEQVKSPHHHCVRAEWVCSEFGKACGGHRVFNVEGNSSPEVL